MADVVQYRMERMTEELDDLERRGLFGSAEIAEIVRHRRDFEYRLKRPSPLKEDFLLYIDYEKRLDALRDLRKRAIIGRLVEKEKAAGQEGQKGGKKWKKSMSDVAGVLRILDIYSKAVVRFKGDLDLWFQYLEFCRERRHGRMKQALAQAIRFHPKVPGLWIYAAAWEFDQNLNVAAARALMQSGLRTCPKSEDLWMEYLRMELTYLNKLKERKLACETGVGSLPKDDKETEQQKEENVDAFVSLSNDILFQRGSLTIQTIYHGAVEALPSSMSLRKRFLEILDDVDLVQSEELKEEIMEDLKKYFSQNEDYWDWLARRQVAYTEGRKDLSKEFLLGKLNKASEVYEEALKVLPTTKMFSLYAKFYTDVILADREDPVSVLINTAFEAGELTSRLLEVYENAEQTGCITKELAYEYISFYLQIGRIHEARDLAKKLCSGRLSEAADVWTLRISTELKWLTSKAASIDDDDLRSISELFRNAMTRVSASEVESLWLMALKFFSTRKKHFEKLVQSLMMDLAKAGQSDNGYTIAFAVISWVLQRDGVKRAREMYKRFLALPHPSLSFFKNCIDLEANLASAGDSDGVANARKLYESALAIYNQSTELWKNYYMMEMKIGTSETATAVYWRARKTLEDTTGFSSPNHL
ncbi:U3 small nucleolar RNA-associated protein 6 [Dioscorea alata]|uniref:U3 small nucleolar RNA-associated protein 6 n=1 Tax=Dioscorea alata TaxID=55571 RepID=A0ACB7UNK3_DIOAL|nr:U3 small nucleolar RNA-associated protein 6 [Dioscorea alata]